MDKCEIQYKTVLLIEKAIAYYFESPRSEKEEEFHERHDKIVDEITLKFPRLYYDPINYYQFACEKFSQYTAEELGWIWSTDSDMARDNAEALWKLLKRSEAMGSGFYYLEKFFDKIKIAKETKKWNKLVKKYK